MPKKILFIEDEEDFAQVVTLYLRKKNFAVTPVSLGKNGLRQLQKKRYDLVILDLSLPDKDGIKICQKIREEKRLPVLILTAINQPEYKVMSFNAGADDYLVKPVSLRELVARIDRLIKKDFKYTFRSSIFQFGKIKFDTVTGILTSKGKSVALTKRERSVLEYLLLKKGQVLTRTEILDHVWGDDIDILSNMVNIIISSLRKKLRQLTSSESIHSVHGLGYKFEPNNINNKQENND